jgi:hypothetical protein
LKKNTFLSSLLTLLLIAGFGFQAYSQISQGGQPATNKFSIANDNYPVFDFPSPNVERLLTEDAVTDKYGIPMRFAECLPASIDLAKDGTWLKMPDGSRVCRLAVSSENAQALLLYYNEFSIPEGGELYLYSTDQWQVIGAFNDETNPKGGTFATEMIYGDKVVLEYVETYGTIEKPVVVIAEVGYVYRSAQSVFGTRGFGGAGACEVNVNCSEGNDWQDHKNAVCRMIVKQGSSSVWCTGATVNNTRQDGTPYLLSADHCGPVATPDEMNTWIFYFRYEGPDCENPTNDTAFNTYTIVGCSKIAAAGGPGVASDFKLVKLNQVVPENYNPYFLGWSIKGITSPEGVTIHQPQGDIRKISTYTTPLISSNWGNIANTHWKVVWSATENGHGVTEGGSSGCPVFNEEGRLLGQLTGGDASCSNLTGPDYYGKFSYSWDKVGAADTLRLKPWLDPDNTGVEEIDGISIVGIRSFEKVAALAVYPNPSPGLVFIDAGDFNGQPVSIEVFNVLGERVLILQNTVSHTGTISIDLSNFNSGVYVVKLLVEGNAYSARVIR